jgi:zinc transporter
MHDYEPIPVGRCPAGNGEQPAAFAWHRLDAGTSDLNTVLTETIGLDALTASALTAEETRPRCTPLGDGALVILRAINTEPGADPEDMVSLRMWIDGAKVVTFQNRHVGAVDDLAAELAESFEVSTPGEFLVALADRMTDRMQDVVDEIDGELEALEDVQSLKPVQELRHAIADLRRKVVVLRRFIAPQRDALEVLVDEEFTWQTEIQERRLRECIDRITRLVEQLDTLHLRASILQDFLSVRYAERLNRTMLLLPIVAGVFLPLSFISGLLGMNVAGIPGASAPQAFLVVTVVLAVVGLVELIVIWRLRLF